LDQSKTFAARLELRRAAFWRLGALVAGRSTARCRAFAHARLNALVAPYGVALVAFRSRCSRRMPKFQRARWLNRSRRNSAQRALSVAWFQGALSRR
jgi:hypothetical protein